MLQISHPLTYRAERRYIHDVLLTGFLGLEYQAREEMRSDVRVSLQGDASGKELILADVLFQTPEDEWLALASLPNQPLDLWRVSEDSVDAKLVSPSVPIIYGARLPGGSYYEASRSKATLGVDILGSAFFMLTRYEEVVKLDRDARERFPAEASLAYQEAFLDRPIVNEYLEVLWWALKRLWPGLRRKRRAFRVCLSHDMDRPHCTKSLPRTLKGVVDDVVRRKNRVVAKRRVRSFARVRRGDLAADLCNTYDFIMDLSEEYGLRSSFNFMTGRSAGMIDGNYSINEAWIRKLLRRISERGHEVGLHPSYNTFRSPERVRREFHILLKVAEDEDIVQREWGGRQHYLRWEAPTTWQAWENCGLDYDATLSFADRIGFRCGVCYEYQVFNLRTSAVLRLREQPLIVMEASALGKRYMGLTFEQARREIVRLKERCKLFDGDFTLLWHNSWLVDEQEREVYRGILET
jgi:peptidoglycan/xylan/chitin deacetylase (PgdA/CDA1 family)